MWILTYYSFKEKFADRHRYFLAFAERHHRIVALLSAITILLTICLSTLENRKGKLNLRGKIIWIGIPFIRLSVRFLFVFPSQISSLSTALSCACCCCSPSGCACSCCSPSGCACSCYFLSVCCCFFSLSIKFSPQHLYDCIYTWFSPLTDYLEKILFCLAPWEEGRSWVYKGNPSYNFPFMSHSLLWQMVCKVLMVLSKATIRWCLSAKAKKITVSSRKFSLLSN
jgi:hypothetical protein